MTTTPSTLPKPMVRIIHLEDNLYDQELVSEMLSSAEIECNITHADDHKTFQTALMEINADLIISDFTMPGYTGVRALQLAQQVCRSVPFIFFSGTIGEDAAIESLKRGATDYVLKQHPDRLVSAVRRALTEAGERAARQHAEQELQRRDVLLREIMENVEDLIAVVDFNGRRMLRSPSYQKLFGQDHFTAGSDFLTEVHPGDKKQAKDNFTRTIAEGIGKRVEYRIVLSDGNVRFVEAQGSVIRHNPNDSYVLWVAHDITEHKLAEAKILEQAALLDKAQDAIFVCNLEEEIAYWNQGATRLYGWTPQEVAGRSLNELLFKDAPLDWMEIRNAVSAKGEWFGELHQVTREGRAVIVQSRQTLIFDSNNEPSSVLYINSDITEKKQIEAQFLRTQRMENLGTLAGGIAHDLNNVLAPIMLAVEIIRDDPLGDSNGKLLETIADSSRRGSDLVKQILSFARGVTGQKLPIQIRHIVSEVVKLVHNTFPRGIVVNSNIPHDLPCIMGDSTQLHQVLLNLCVNARDAMQNEGSLTIEASTVTLDGKKLPSQPAPRHPQRMRYRLRHPAGFARQNIRAFLHHQGYGQRHGARSLHGDEHCKKPWRIYRSLQPTGQRHDIPCLFSHPARVDDLEEKSRGKQTEAWKWRANSRGGRRACNQ